MNRPARDSDIGAGGGKYRYDKHYGYGRRDGN